MSLRLEAEQKPFLILFAACVRVGNLIIKNDTYNSVNIDILAKRNLHIEEKEVSLLNMLIYYQPNL